MALSAAHEGNALLSDQRLQHWEKIKTMAARGKRVRTFYDFIGRGVHATCWQFQSACGHQRALFSWCQSKSFGKRWCASLRVPMKLPEVTLALFVVMHHFSWANPDKALDENPYKTKKTVFCCRVYLCICHLLERLSLDEWVLEIKLLTDVWQLSIFLEQHNSRSVVNICDYENVGLLEHLCHMCHTLWWWWLNIRELW